MRKALHPCLPRIHESLTQCGDGKGERQKVMFAVIKSGGRQYKVYKPKKRIRHRRGHRQELTFLTIDDIVADGKSLITGAAPEAREEEEEELPIVEKLETPPESTELEAATGGVTETTEPEEEEKKPSRRRRTRKVEETESEAEE